MFANHISNKGLVSRTSKETIQFSYVRQWPNYTMSQGCERSDLQMRYTRGQRACAKMLSIISHQGNANQTHSEVPLHTHEAEQNNKDTLKCWQGRGEIGNPTSFSSEYKNDSVPLENSLAVPPKVRHRVDM